MVLVCPQCSARLQLDDAKAPAGAFSVRCPKCQASVSHTHATMTETSRSADVPPAADGEPSSRFEAPTSAPRFKPREEQAAVVVDEAQGGMEEIARLLAAVLNPSPHDKGGRK